MAEEVQCIVLGAGMTGLCTAFYLARKLGPENVLVLEADERVGGTTRTDTAEGFICEWGPNGFLDREPLTLQWVDDLGITDQLVRANPSAARRFIQRNGRLHEIKAPPAFLASPLLSLRGRARLLCEPLIPGKKDDSPESVWDFAARRIGREAADTLVGPMVSGVYGGDAKQLSLAHCFPRMAAMEREYGGLFKALIAKKKENKAASPMGPSGTLTTCRAGIGSVPEEAARQLKDRIRTGIRATGLRRREGGYEIETGNGATFRTQSVVVAVPAYVAARLVEGLDQRLVPALDGIAYAGLAVLCTGYGREQVKRDLDGFGYLVPRTQGVRALGCLWTSSIFPSQAPADRVLLRTMYGGFTDPEAVRLSDAELLEHLHREVHPLLGIDTPPEFVRIYRFPKGIPQYLMGHGTRLKSIGEAEAHYPGLVFAGNAYRGIGLNDCVLSAHRAVDAITG
jgi:oxygen-dependent protoporphyrinogen oxidase